jgi:putative transposase
MKEMTMRHRSRQAGPETLNTEQGGPFTSMTFADVPLRKKIAISMDGRGVPADNVAVKSPLAISHI